MNNDIVKGFDDEKEDSIKVRLEAGEVGRVKQIIPRTAPR